AQLGPEGADITRTAALLSKHRQALLGRGVPARAVTFTSAAAGDDLVRIALQQDVDLLLVDGSPDLKGSTVLETLLARAPCDVAVHVGREDPAPEGPVFVLFDGAAADWPAVALA